FIAMIEFNKYSYLYFESTMKSFGAYVLLHSNNVIFKV
ncbi:DNA oxidative demethylase ALKBH2, partial [Araneus ventricosus]